MVARIRRNPKPLVVIAIAVCLLAVFFVVVAPLFDTSGAPSAELAGLVPSQAVAGRQLEIDVGLDNVGYSLINPVCVRASTSGPLHADYAIFQGLDRENFKNGGACGGSLNGQDDISVQVFLTPTAAGRGTVALSPAEGGRDVGSALSGTLQISGG